MSNITIWSMDWTLLSATSRGQNWPGSDGDEGVPRIPQNSSITAASPLDGLVSYSGHLFGGRYYPPPRRDAIGVFYSPSRLDYKRSFVNDYRYLHLNFYTEVCEFLSIRGSPDVSYLTRYKLYKVDCRNYLRLLGSLKNKIFYLLPKRIW